MVLFDARGYDSKAMVISDFLVYEFDPAHQWWAVDPGGSQEAEAIGNCTAHSNSWRTHHAPPTEFCPFDSTKTVRLLRIF